MLCELVLLLVCLCTKSFFFCLQYRKAALCLDYILLYKLVFLLIHVVKQFLNVVVNALLSEIAEFSHNKNLIPLSSNIKNPQIISYHLGVDVYKIENNRKLHKSITSLNIS